MRTGGLKSWCPSESHRALEGQDWRVSQECPLRPSPRPWLGARSCAVDTHEGKSMVPGVTTCTWEQEGKSHCLLLLTPHSLSLLG